ncbi:UDP-N-acetylmuramoyl-tripeptide--D-alanyl-D-alanine ligase [Kosmotoga sp. DU53]|uniref:UDP-N-acetylmuramoyl-tripeptide--D-alanyl-D- alanine ligase n=1 Tax=Kosmotoga sp. DU53 TaxID=1310160 RepID=UPI0009ED90C8|nr:UDP-N-acetylmuramoyl-tripeptide--D-alanyl-D-alanine ligase [Kosmotoga sp. DU53]
MEPISLSKIIEATGGTLLSGTPDVEIFGISTDTRTIHKGDLFVALEGERFDGHYFIDEAFKKGAIGAIVSREVESKNIIIKVRDTLKTLGDIAKIYREEFDIPVIAVTGSNGKTTTKEMLGYILTREFKTVKAKGSYNNFVGVPLTLLEMDRHTQLAVLEMETNLLGGIKRLCEIAKPSVGVVTNIGDTHLQFLKTREGVYQEKSELVESLPEDGVAVLNADDPYVLKMKEISRTKRIVTFGVENKSEFSASNIRVGDTFLEFTLNNNYRVKLNTISYCNVYNGLAAIAVSHCGFWFEFRESDRYSERL